MKNTELNKKIVTATKWSTVTEIAAKLVAPISTMVLARVLSPEAFGVLVTATMVISFAEIFTDAGFQKYIIQHEFEDDKSLYRATNVAFISNLAFSVLIWLILVIFSSQIAELVGNPGYGLVISVSSICIPLTAFSSIQMAIYKRRLNFKKLFIVRIIGVCIPVVITIPLAFALRSYWALIVGMIALNLSNAIILNLKSEWKPKIWYSVLLFKEMFAFTFWSMLEAISIWLTSYIDIFLVGRLLNEYYLGIYRTSMSTVAQFLGLITAATTPVLFSSLSRLQKDEKEFKGIYYKFQKIVGCLVIPIGTFIFLYRDTITLIMLGSQWGDAADFIGIWALMSGITIVLSHYSSEVYRAKGRPKLSFIAQITHIACIIPVILLAIPHGFRILCECRALVRFELIFINVVFMAFIFKFSPIKQLWNVFPAIIASASMCIPTYLISSSESLYIIVLSMVASVGTYIVVISCFPKERYLLKNIKSYIKK